MKLYLLIAFMLCTIQHAFAQMMEGTSSFYNKPVGPVKSILVEYRTEMFSKKIMDKYQKSFAESCATKNVIAYFAVIGSNEADSLQKIAEFVCRVSNNNFSPSATQVSRTSVFNAGNLRDRKSYSILGFTNIYSEIPDWKCFCSIKSLSTSSADPAKCLFEQLLADGIIKQQ